jgi:hypothetical protein
VELLGRTAEELYEMKMNGDTMGYEEVFSNAQFKTFAARVWNIPFLSPPPFSYPSSSPPFLSSLGSNKRVSTMNSE